MATFGSVNIIATEKVDPGNIGIAVGILLLGLCALENNNLTK